MVLYEKINKAIKNHFRNYLLIFIGSIINILSIFIIMKIIKILLSQDALNQFVLTLRYSSFITPVLMAGMGIALPAMLGESNKRESRKINDIITAGFIIYLLWNLIIFALLWNNFIFNKIKEIISYKELWVLYFYSLGVSTFGLAYAIHRGLGNYKKIETKRIFTLLIPLVAFSAACKNITTYIFLASIVYILNSIFLLRGYLRRTKEFNILSQMFTFGIKRLPNDILYALIPTLPLLYISKYIGLDEAAQFGICFMISNAFMMLLGPISTLLLPIASNIQAVGDGFKDYLKTIPVIVIIMGFIVMLGLKYITPIFYDISNRLIYIVAFAFPFSGLYILTRSILDGVVKKPYTTYVLITAIIIEYIFLENTELNTNNIAFIFLITVICMGLSYYALSWYVQRNED